ncbi:GTP-binding protein [Boothiomyces sp. JEL0838]|nr:GTP-binding protein [Boothiomyces sp. JEL0838]
MSGLYDHVVKVLLIGDSGVGKSCLLMRFCNDEFTPSFITTIGIDFKVRTIEVDGKRIKLQIWDTAGQERFQTITASYYRGAMGIAVTFDLTSDKSFASIPQWLRNIEENAPEGVNKLLVGNKCDLIEQAQVTDETACRFAEENGMKYVRASAKANIGVEEIFFTLAKDIIERLGDATIPEKPRNTVKVVESEVPVSQSSCC